MLSKKVKIRIRQNKNYRKNIHQVKQILKEDGNIACIGKIKRIFNQALCCKLPTLTICSIVSTAKRTGLLSDFVSNKDPSMPVTLVKHTLTRPLAGFKYGEMELYSHNIEPN